MTTDIKQQKRKLVTALGNQRNINVDQYMQQHQLSRARLRQLIESINNDAKSSTYILLLNDSDGLATTILLQDPAYKKLTTHKNYLRVWRNIANNATSKMRNPAFWPRPQLQEVA